MDTGVDQEVQGRENLQNLINGFAPDAATCLALSEGVQFLSDFWSRHYLDQYIREGGSKIKFVTGRPGCGKTHLLHAMEEMARQKGYKVASVSAAKTWLHDFSLIYLEVLRQVSITEILVACANSIVRNMGYDPAEIPEGMTFIDYLSQQGMADAIQRRELRVQLKEMFLDNPLLDNNFALSCSLITGGILGHPVLEDANRDLLLGYLHGEPGIKTALLRSLGLSPEKLTRYNARHMLRSLSEVIRLGGSPGLLVTVDQMDVMLNRSGMQELHYTTVRRQDTYESIRLLIDDIDTMHNVMFVFAFDRDLLDTPKVGIMSYSALMMRIQNEILSERFNCFADIANLDDLARQQYDVPTVLRMAEKLAQYLSERGCQTYTLTQEQAEKLIHQAGSGTVGLPRLVNRAVLMGVPEETIEEVSADA
ncbi:MAG: DUF2791 family P-loop domain-containing protein [Clostridia bacterium]|nr:DUF2791 family P-loop domain-containing protein [Clostridia bacterium]